MFLLLSSFVRRSNEETELKLTKLYNQNYNFNSMTVLTPY